MKAKKALILFAVLLMLAALTGCGRSGVTKGDVLRDLNGSAYLPVSGLQIEKVDITQQRTDKKSGTDTVYVDASGSVGDTNYEFRYILEYLYFDKGGWILQNVEPWQEETWELEPVSDRIVLRDITANDYGVLSGAEIADSSSVWDASLPASGSCEKTLLFTVRGNGYHGSVTATACYALTSAGWEYQYHYYDSVEVYPEYSVTAADAEDYVEDLYGLPATETAVEPAWDICRETHYVVIRDERPYLTIATTVRLDCSYDQESLDWTVTDCTKTEENYEWDVVGTWFAEGTAESDILYPNGFRYRVKCVVTQEDAQTFRVDYDYLNPIVPWTSFVGVKEDDTGSGTVYVDVSGTHQDNGYCADHCWKVLTDLPDTNDQLLFSEEEGVRITHFSWGSYRKDLQRIA